jgi:hypothetical protein
MVVVVGADTFFSTVTYLTSFTPPFLIESISA